MRFPEAKLSAPTIPVPAWTALETEQKAPLRGRRDIVVIGAAMGGLTAICKLLSDLPPSFDAAILIALDLGSQPASIVLQILRSYSQLPVRFAADGALVRRGRVIVAPARRHMQVAQPGLLTLQEESTFAAGGPSVNELFRTAAAAYGDRVIGIVLSGASHDGTTGLSLIEAAGGIGIVQDPDEAFDGSMPSNALRGDHPNYCSALARMADLLVALAAGTFPSGQLSTRKTGSGIDEPKERK